MREIKFRAWYGEEMCDFFHCWLEPEKLFRGIRLDAAYRTSLAQCTPKAIMQYTGIKDRNGVEIYEGDILRVCDYKIRGDGHFDDVIVRVFWSEGDLSYFASGGNFAFHNFAAALSDYDIEVLGNIYENPDLVGHAIK